MSRILVAAVVWLAASAAVAPRASHSAEVLQNLPADAQGFVLVHHLGAVDRKFQQLFSQLRPEWNFGPLAFLGAATGIRDGLDLEGDFLLAILPAREGGPLEFCVWLPVRDYDRLLASLGNKSTMGVTAVTIAGEDLLIAKHGAWALVMDPDQRERMERMLTTNGHPPEVVLKWQPWIEANDISAVAMSKGVQALLQSAHGAESQVPNSTSQPNEAGEDIFGAADENSGTPFDSPGANGAASGVLAQLRSAVAKLKSAAPELAKLAANLEFAGVALRIDDTGNVITALRASSGQEFPAEAITDSSRSSIASPPAIAADGEFIVQGAGEIRSTIAAEMTSAYVHLLVDELKTDEHIQLDPATLDRFYAAARQAAAEATSAAVLSLPGEQQEGVYTNDFLVLHVKSADKFMDLAGEAMRLWNQMHRDAQGGPRLTFDVEELPAGDIKLTQYSLDLAAVEGAPALPELRKAMEGLFGPGGEFRLLVAKLDEHTALLAAATPEQVAARLKQLRSKSPSNWGSGPPAEANRLLPSDANWRAFFSPHGFTAWQARQMAAIVGTEVIGGPLVKEFPASSPIGLAGGMKDRELWMDVAVPAATVHSAGIYLQPRNRRVQRAR